MYFFVSNSFSLTMQIHNCFLVIIPIVSPFPFSSLGSAFSLSTIRRLLTQNPPPLRPSLLTHSSYYWKNASRRTMTSLLHSSCAPPPASSQAYNATHGLAVEGVELLNYNFCSVSCDWGEPMLQTKVSNLY